MVFQKGGDDVKFGWFEMCDDYEDDMETEGLSLDNGSKIVMIGFDGAVARLYVQEDMSGHKTLQSMVEARRTVISSPTC